MFTSTLTGSFIRIVLLLLTLLGMRNAFAHDVPGSAVYLDMDADAINVQMDLPLAELQLAIPEDLHAALRPDLSLQTPGGALLAKYIDDHFRIEDAQAMPLRQRVTHLAVKRIGDGDCLVVMLHADAGTASGMSSFVVHDSVIIHQVMSHKIFLFQRRDFAQGLLGDQPLLRSVLFSWSDSATVTRQDSSSWRGMRALFDLGIRHIASGADHLLFLLTLLLIAPLRMTRGRWQEAVPVRQGLRRMVSIITGFTLGHSLTLALAALGWVSLPTQWVEVLVAASILVSAIHALRPYALGPYAGNEIWIASGFGLVHGLAFAEALTGFGYSGSVLTLSLLSFNAGIEIMQLLIVAACLPWLMLMARTRWYSRFRVIMAVAAMIAASGWIATRAFGYDNPIEPIISTMTQHASWMLAVLAGISVMAHIHREWSAV